MTTAHHDVLHKYARAGGVAAALLALSATAAIAQPFETTADLRTACQTRPGNVVVLDQSVKIASGARPPSTEQVATGCTIVLGPNAKLETEGVSLTFAGALVVQSQVSTEVKLTGSSLSASSVTFALTGTGSALEANFSNLQATAGGLQITMGHEGKLSVLEHLPAGPHEALAATTTVTIRAGQKFTGQLSEMRVDAPLGFEVAMSGADGLFAAKQVWITAADGSIALASSAKAMVELSETNLVFGNAASLRLAGASSLVKLQQVGMRGASDTQDAPGGILIEAGSGAAEGGSIEASEVAFYDVASIRVRASVSGLRGGLKLQKSHLSASGDIALETGAQGQTEVNENYGGSSTRFRVATGAGGSCVGQLNNVSAPSTAVCP